MMIIGIAIPAGLLIATLTAMIIDYIDLHRQVEEQKREYNELKKRL